MTTTERMGVTDIDPATVEGVKIDAAAFPHFTTVGLSMRDVAASMIVHEDGTRWGTLDAHDVVDVRLSALSTGALILYAHDADGNIVARVMLLGAGDTVPTISIRP